MKGRIQYILYVLLFILTETLCGQQSVSQQPDRDFCYAASTHLQQMPVQDIAARHYAHLMVASEITASIPEPHSDQKIIILHPSSVVWCAAMGANPPQAVSLYSAVVHPHPTAYYVFSLGKIVI